jgi:hypothetical protein
LSLAPCVIRALMLHAAPPVGRDVDRRSFTGGLRILQNRLPGCADRTPQTRAAGYAAVPGELRQEGIEPRRNRIHPRVSKRKRSKGKKQRPEQRGIPPMQKRFIEIVFMLHRTVLPLDAGKGEGFRVFSAKPRREGR